MTSRGIADSSGWPRLVSRAWGDELRAGLDRDPGHLRIVCPFVKAAVLTDVLERHDPEKISLVTRFRLADFRDGVSDIEALRRVIDAGGRVRGVRGLHAKVYVFGTSRAAVTSANLTSRGMRGNHEFGCVSEDSAFMNECTRYFDELWGSAGADLMLGQLDEWEAQVDVVLNSGARQLAKDALPDHGAQVPQDLAGPDDGVVERPEGWLAESGQAFVKFFGEGTNRAAWSFSTIDELRRSGCHWACTYPTAKRPRSVREGDTLFIGRLVRDPNDTLIFGRAIGREHVEGRDEATEAEIEQRPWKKKWGNYVRVHHAEFLAGELSNGVSLSELMEVLGTNAFRSTQDHARAGAGNVNPRKAYMQQPSVRLTDKAAAWLTERLEAAFVDHGRLPADDLDALDWPEDT